LAQEDISYKRFQQVSINRFNKNLQQLFQEFFLQKK